MEQQSTHEAGERFGPYTLERSLGRGAAAEVWQVVEAGALGFQKRQALKLLRPPPGEMESQKKALNIPNTARKVERSPVLKLAFRYGLEEEDIYSIRHSTESVARLALFYGITEKEVKEIKRASIDD